MLPIEIPLRFSYWRKGIVCHGSGRVSDLGRRGIRFHAGGPPPKGVEVELVLAWPIFLPSVRPLELVIRGEVVRSNSKGTVVRMHQYEFPACGQGRFDQAAAGVNVCSLIA